MNYHAHVYFDESQETLAEEFRQKHVLQIERLQLWVGSLVRQNVGPHPRWMFEVHVSTPTLNSYINFLESENPGLSILLHEDTEDDYRDHTEGARWFGSPLKIDFSFFDRLSKDESLRIHPLKK